MAKSGDKSGRRQLNIDDKKIVEGKTSNLPSKTGNPSGKKRGNEPAGKKK